MDKPLFEKGQLISGSKGKKYLIDKWLNDPREETKSPDYSPTTLTPRLPRPRPQIWKAIESRNQNKAVAIKVSYQDDLFYLENEYRSLKRLNHVRNQVNLIPLDIAPKLVDYKKTDDQLVYLIYEWLDPKNWESLSTIIIDPKRKQPGITGDPLQNLRKSLRKACNKLHNRGIIHGDLKDEHILVRKKIKKPESLEDYDFKKIKIIDFGFSYLLPSGRFSKNNGFDNSWRGGSVGFSNPFFWRSENKNRAHGPALKSIDWYSVYSILYYASTGECFPLASPSYRIFARYDLSETKNFHTKMRSNLIDKWRAKKKEDKELLSEVISELTSDNIMKGIFDQELGPSIKLFASNLFLMFSSIFVFSIGLITESISKIIYGSILALLFMLTPFLVKDLEKNEAGNKKFAGKNKSITNILVFITLVIFSVSLVQSNHFGYALYLLFTGLILFALHRTAQPEQKEDSLVLGGLTFLAPVFMPYYSFQVLPYYLGSLTRNKKLWYLFGPAIAFITAWVFILSPSAPVPWLNIGLFDRQVPVFLILFFFWLIKVYAAYQLPDLYLTRIRRVVIYSLIFIVELSILIFLLLMFSAIEIRFTGEIIRYGVFQIFLLVIFFSLEYLNEKR